MKFCPCCSRRHLITSSLALASLSVPLPSPVAASAATAIQEQAALGTYEKSDTLAASLLAARESRPQWVDELYTWLLGTPSDLYDSKAKPLRNGLLGRQLQDQIQASNNRPFEILELGIGSGPNINFYSTSNVHVTGVDPSKAALRYTSASADRAGLGPGQLSLLQGVGEAIPAQDGSVDAVVTTLVLCSVADLKQTVSEIARVLRPGGCYYFLEHVAAPAGSSLRAWQETLDPLQQFFADGCHLTREPLPVIRGAGFSGVQAREVVLEGLNVISPHIVGRAQKA